MKQRACSSHAHGKNIKCVPKIQIHFVRDIMTFVLTAGKAGRINNFSE